MGKSSTYIPYVWISQGLRRACVGPTQGSGRIPCAGFHPTARPWARLVLHFGLPQRPNLMLSPAKKLLTNRLGSGTPPGTGRLAIGGRQLSGAHLACLSSSQLAQLARELSLAGLE